MPYNTKENWEDTPEGREAFKSIGSPIIKDEGGGEPPPLPPPVYQAPEVQGPGQTERQMFDNRVEQMGGLKGIQDYQKAINDNLARYKLDKPYEVSQSVDQAYAQFKADREALEEGKTTYRERKAETAQKERDRLVDELAGRLEPISDASNGVKVKVLEIERVPNTDNFDVKEIYTAKARGEDGNLVTLTLTDKQAEDALGATFLVDSNDYKNATTPMVKEIDDREYKQFQKASDRLSKYGFISTQYPEGGASFESYDKGKTFNIANLAKYVRDNPDDGLETLKDYGFKSDVISEINRFNNELSQAIKNISKLVTKPDKKPSEVMALTDAMSIAGVYDPKKMGATLQSVGGSLQWVDNKTKRLLTEDDIVTRQWSALNNEQKESVAPVYAGDYFKGSYFAETNKILSRVAEKSGISGQLAYAPILPITNPIAKQITLKEARKELNNIYSNELDVLKIYKNSDGTVSLKRLEENIQNNPGREKDLLSKTGYNTIDDLKANMEYYNNSITVTPKEWAIAGLTGVLDVAMMGGFAGLGVPGAALETVAPPALGALTLPDTIKMVRDPDVPSGEKAVAGVTQALLFSGFIPLGIRGTQQIRLARRHDYVPLRSMVIEGKTARVEFTPEQHLAMVKAGVTEADVIKAGTDLNQQLVSGKKVASVKLGPVEVKIKNTEYQKAETLSLFNSTPDITLLDRGGATPVFRTFYTAGKAALEPMRRSYLTGQRATSPGIVEIKIADPTLIAKYAPQEKLINGKRVLEPEAPFPSLDELQGKGYMLEPIPGPAGRGVTFDAELGKVEIRRYNLVKIADNPTGLRRVYTGQRGEGGTVAIGDLHGATNFRATYDDINNAFGKGVVQGNPKNPKTWNWKGSKETIVILGDSIDRGPNYQVWRETFNRLQDQAKAQGGKVVRLLGNHELAYLSDDAIKGVEYTDKLRAAIKAGIKEDIAVGRVKAAVSENGTLYTHAGVSTGAFPKYKGKSADYIAADLNKRFLSAVKRDKYTDAMFAKGRSEKGNSLSKNERAQGGIFWLRPSEATVDQLDIGARQVVGHNPGQSVRQLWGKNFIEADVSRLRGGRGAYADTPFAKTEAVDVVTESLSGKQPTTGPKSALRNTKLSALAMKDTVADFVLGWDGRIYAIDNLKWSKEAVNKMVDVIDQQIVKRRNVGDSIGVKYLQRQRSELLNPSGKDYLYGGIGFWRDIVMGRQNSVRVIDNLSRAGRRELNAEVKNINKARQRITAMSDRDVELLFGRSKKNILKELDTGNLADDVSSREMITNYRKLVVDKSKKLVDIVDDGVKRNIEPHLDRAILANRYAAAMRDITSSQALLSKYLARYSDDRRTSTERYVAKPQLRESRAIEFRERATRITTSKREPSYRTTESRLSEGRSNAIYERNRSPRVISDRIGEPARNERVPPGEPPRPPNVVPNRFVPPPVNKMAGNTGRTIIKPPGGKTSPEPTKAQLAGAVAWPQGFGWRVAYRNDGGRLVSKFFRGQKPPKGVKMVAQGPGEAARGIQQYSGGAPVEGTVNMGAVKVTVNKPQIRPGAKGTISFASVPISGRRSRGITPKRPRIGR